MANELRHTAGAVPTKLEQSEWEGTAKHVCNSQATGDLIYASSATQLTRLPIAASSILISSGGIPAWSTTLPNFTSGTIAMNGTLTMFAGVTMVGSVYDSYYLIRGSPNSTGGGSYIALYGKDLDGLFIISTPDLAGTSDVERFRVSGVLATAVATWSAITHVNFNLSDYLGLWKTDVDSAVEAELWYDDSENVLKYFNGTSVKTIATTA